MKENKTNFEGDGEEEVLVRAVKRVAQSIGAPWVDDDAEVDSEDFSLLFDAAVNFTGTVERVRTDRRFMML